MHSLLKFYVFLWKNKAVFFFFLIIVPLIGLLYLNNNQKRYESVVQIMNYSLENLNLADYKDYNAKLSIKDSTIKASVFANSNEIAMQTLKPLNKAIITDISYDILKDKKAAVKTQSFKVTSLLDKKNALDELKENNNLTGTKLKVYNDEVKIINSMYEKELVKYQEMSLDYESFNLDAESKVTYLKPVEPKMFYSTFLFIIAGFFIALFTIMLKNLTHKTYSDELEIKQQTGIKAFEGLSRFKKLTIENNRLVSGKLKVSSLTEISRIFKYISQRDRKVFEVVSSIKGEGNSSLIQALAEHASLNNKVLLIDMNLRNMDLSVNITKKLENWELEAKDFSKIDEKTIALSSNLDFLPALKDEESLQVLKTTKNLKAFIKYLERKYDYIFFDTTAVFSVNIHNLDSVILSSVVDGVLVNYMANKTPSNKLLEAIENLRMVDANILGIVTNNRYNPKLKSELLAFCSHLEKFNKSLADSLRVKILKSSLLDEE